MQICLVDKRQSPNVTLTRPTEAEWHQRFSVAVWALRERGSYVLSILPVLTSGTADKDRTNINRRSSSRNSYGTEPLKLQKTPTMKPGSQQIFLLFGNSQNGHRFQ